MTIEKMQLNALKKAKINDNNYFCFEIIDIKKININKNIYSLDDYECKELKKAISGGARFMLLVCENDTMCDDTLTLQPVDIYNMQALKELNIEGLSSVAAKIYKALKAYKPFNGGAVLSLGLDYEALDGARVNISKL